MSDLDPKSVLVRTDGTVVDRATGITAGTVARHPSRRGRWLAVDVHGREHVGTSRAHAARLAWAAWRYHDYRLAIADAAKQGHTRWVDRCSCGWPSPEPHDARAWDAHVGIDRDALVGDVAG